MLLALIRFGAFVLLLLAQRAMWRGDYDRALVCLVPLGSMASKFRGLTLGLAGRFEESEKIYRKRLAEARTSSARAKELNSLADALLNQERYAEAKSCLDEAMLLDIGHGGP